VVLSERALVEWRRLVGVAVAVAVGVARVLGGRVGEALGRSIGGSVGRGAGVAGAPHGSGCCRPCSETKARAMRADM
jgi:hypothetical protein